MYSELSKMKPKFALLDSIFIYFYFICPVSSFFDVDELKSINYGIDIRNEPVVMKTDIEATDLNTLQLTSKYGQTYQCNFPNTEEQEKEKEEAEKVAIETGIPDLLKPMETGPCLKLNNGWWTYEFCYGRAVRQYHLNEEGRIDGEVLSLGVYESEFDWEDNSGQTDQEKKQNRLRRYHTQQYVNGTNCDLNGNQRKTEVRFICEEGNGDYINRVDEPETCSYIMTVHTTKICHHPLLKPPTPTKTVSITCHPLLTVVQYQEYLDEIEAKDIKKRQEEEKQRLQEEEQRLAKEKAKYSKQAQEAEGGDQLGETVTDGKSSVSDELLQEMINAASTQLQAGETVTVDNTMFHVIDDPADMEEFIKKAIKEINKAGKESTKKKTGEVEEGETVDDETPLEEIEFDAELNDGLNTDNMQRFGDAAGEEEDITNSDVQQAVDALKKVQKDQEDAISQLSRLQNDNFKRAYSKNPADDDDEEEEEDEGLVEDDDGDQDLKQGGDTKVPVKGEKMVIYNVEEDKFIPESEGAADDQELTDLMQKVNQQLHSMINAPNVMAKLGDDLNELMEEDKTADKEIKTIKSKYQDKRDRLVDIKQRLKKLMEKQYESIVKEAEEELGLEDEIDRTAATRELAQTLDGLLAKLDKTEQEIQDVDKELEQFAEFDSEEKVKSVPPVRDDLEPVKGPDLDEDSNDRVQVRVSRIKPGQKFATSETDKTTEALEKSVQEELAKAGFPNGDKIQVKIITGYYEGDDDSVHTLSDKDSETFKNLIVNLIGGHHDGDREAARIQEQEDNYGVVFGKTARDVESMGNSEDTFIQSNTDTITHKQTDAHTDADKYSHTDIKEEEGS